MKAMNNPITLTDDIIGNIEAKNIDTSTDDIDDELVEAITEPESITSKDAIEKISKLHTTKFDLTNSYPDTETITIKESDFLANGTDSDHEENFESDFEERRNFF
ncbi:hypothetical protein BpHYR1_016891 [Brachionus plicatilis]|uniref:Uncharacterized protein n=1 Tax=Brachionus plicatilis TaxID=10195 RepID=A0A3M7RG28_BRAPC|nr:hypothetical protein BpHYR1_016891 [Brachionus plicatilis]